MQQGGPVHATRRAGPRNKEGRSMQQEGPVHTKRGASRSMQQEGLVHAKLRSLTCADFEYVFTIPTSANILPRLRSCYHPLFFRLRNIAQAYM